MLQPINHQLLSDIKHGFFTKSGGVSTGLYDSLNVGFGSNDDIQNIKQNRLLIADFFGAEHLYSTFQSHSAQVVVIDSPDKLWTDENAPQADAIVCNVKGIAIGAMSADCGNILFADIENQVVGTAHAGWRGAKDNIMQNVIDEMEKLGATRQNIVAVVGAVIAQDSYEVGDEFYDDFINDDNTNEKYFIRKDKYHFDLNKFICDKLNQIGVKAVGSLYDTHQINTYTDVDRFYSFRRATHKGESDYGRNIAVICL